MCRYVRSIGSMAAALAWMVASSAGAATLTVGNGSGAPEYQVFIPISYDGAAAATHIQFTVALDQSRPGGAPPLAADPVPKAGTAPIVDLNNYAGVSATGLAEADRGILKAGNLMTIALSIPDTAPEGTVYFLTLSEVTAASPTAGTVSLQTVSGSVTVKGPKVTPPSLATVSVIPNTATLIVGESQMFQVMGADAAGKPFVISPSDKDPITWQVDRSDLAQIDANGVLIALASGSVKVSATFEKLTGTAAVTIAGPTGKAPDDTVSIGSASARPGDQVDLPIVLTGATSLAELDLSLDLTTKAGSPLTLVGIKAASGTGATGLPFPANPSMQSIVLVAGDTALAPGTVATLTLAVPADAKGSYTLNPVVLRARDPSGNEFVLPSKAGTLTVGEPQVVSTLAVGSASGAPGSQVSIPISYDGAVASNRIQFTLALDRSTPGGALPLVVNPVPKAGTAPIVDLNNYAGVSVTGLADAGSGVLKAGDLMSITLTIPDMAAEGTVYSLALSDVTAVGTTGGTVSLQTVSGSVTVKGPKVTPPSLATVSVIPNTATLIVGESQMFQVMGADAAGKPFVISPSDKDPITWQVDRSDLAQIDANGVLIALASGSVKVSATFEKLTGTAAVTIAGPTGKAPDDTVSIGSASAHPGDRVDLPIVLTGATSLAELDLSLDLTTKAGSPLTLVGIKAASGTGATGLPFPANPSMQSIVLVAGDTALAPGTVATLTLTVPADAKGSYTLNPVVLRARDPSGNEFVLTATAGTLTIGEPPPALRKGDANGDGVVDIRDAIATLRVAVALDNPTPAQRAAMDVNGDGKIDVRDVVLILQFIVGLVKTL